MTKPIDHDAIYRKGAFDDPSMSNPIRPGVREAMEPILRSGRHVVAGR